MASHFSVCTKLRLVRGKNNSRKKEIISHIYGLRVKRNWESTVVKVISNDFSRSPVTKSKFSHANLVTDYNLIFLKKLILQKLVFQILRNQSVNSVCIQFHRDLKLYSFLFKLRLLFS